MTICCSGVVLWDWEGRVGATGARTEQLHGVGGGAEEGDVVALEQLRQTRVLARVAPARPHCLHALLQRHAAHELHVAVVVRRPAARHLRHSEHSAVESNFKMSPENAESLVKLELECNCPARTFHVYCFMVLNVLFYCRDRECRHRPTSMRIDQLTIKVIRNSFRNCSKYSKIQVLILPIPYFENKVQECI